MRKKKSTQSENEKPATHDEFVVSQRGKAVTGPLAGLTKSLAAPYCVKITITPENPDDWPLIREYYLRNEKQLLKDLLPFMAEGAFSLAKKQTIPNMRKNFIDILRVQAALLHGFLKEARKCKDRNLLTSLDAAVASVADLKDIRRPDGKHDCEFFTRQVMEGLYSAAVIRNRLRLRNTTPVFKQDDFNLIYIKTGTKLLNELHGYKLVSDGHMILTLMSRGKFASIRHPQFFALMLNLMRSVCENYRPVSSPIVLYSEGVVCELDVMRGIIEKAFPTTFLR